MSSNVKETVIQFGEGGFLRGFVDYFFHKLREKGLYDGKIVVVQPIEKGMCQMLADQNCEYNLFLRGIDNGEVVNEHTHITSISRALNPYTQYDEYIALATSPDFLLLDEPAAGMNPQESTELMRFIRHIRDEFDLTILLIEHDMKVVMGVCQYIWVLEYGQLIAEGDPDAIRNNPRVIEAYLGEDVSNHA